MLLWAVAAGVACLILIPISMRVSAQRRKMREAQEFVARMRPQDVPSPLMLYGATPEDDAEPAPRLPPNDLAADLVDTDRTASAARQPEPIELEDAQGAEPTEVRRRRALARQLRDAPVQAWLAAAQEAPEDDAYILLNEATHRFPESPEAHHALAQAAEARGDHATAERAWRDAAALRGEGVGGVDIVTAPAYETAYTLEIAPERSPHLYAEATSQALSREETTNELSRSSEPEFEARAEVFGTPGLSADVSPEIAPTAPKHASLEATPPSLAYTPQPTEFDTGSPPAELLLEAPKEASLAAAPTATPKDDRYSALLAAALRLPHTAQVHHDLARAAEEYCDWRTAECAWRAFIAVEPNESWAYEALKKALQKHGQERVLEVGAGLNLSTQLNEDSTRSAAEKSAVFLSAQPEGRLDTVLDEGWSGMEGWGVWGVGKRHALILTEFSGYELEIECHVALDGSTEYQTVAVEVNTQPVATWAFTRTNNRAVRSIQLPETDQPIRVEFMPRTNFQPSSELPDNGDFRLLGMAICWIRLVPPGNTLTYQNNLS